MHAFYAGLFLVCAATMTYEVVLTRLLSSTSWYYLAFLAVSTALFGMTAGALFVQLRADLFPPELDAKRRAQAAFAMGVSLPLSLMTMLAIPIEVSRSLQTLVSFVLFSAVIAVPFA